MNEFLLSEFLMHHLGKKTKQNKTVAKHHFGVLLQYYTYPAYISPTIYSENASQI